MLVKSYFKRNIIVSRYNPIRQTIPMVHNSIDEVKFAHIIFTAKFLETQIVISSYTCIRHILSYFKFKKTKDFVGDYFIG